MHGWVLASANRCRNAGLSQSDAVRVITESMTRPPSPGNEVTTTVAKAFAGTAQRSPGSRLDGLRHRQRAPVPLTEIAFDLGKLRRFAEQIPAPNNWRHWLWERSPKRPEAMNAWSFLTNIFRPDEIALVFDVFEAKQPFATVQISAPMDCRVPALLRQGGRYGKGVWFLCNPVDGAWHHNPRQSTESCRSEESVTDFRFAVLESDEAPPNLWLAFIAQLPIRVVAIYTSGGKSIHVLWRVDAPSKSAWDETIAPLKRQTKVLGADPGCLSAVRLTRLPQCWRPEKGGFQRLLYLNPNPTPVPLADQSIAQSRARTLARWRRDCPRWNKAMEAFA